MEQWRFRDQKEFGGTIRGTVAEKRNCICCVSQRGPREDAGHVAFFLTRARLSFRPASLHRPRDYAECESSELPRAGANQEFMEDFIAFPTENFSSITYGKHKSQWESNRIQQGRNHSSRCCTQLFLASAMGARKDNIHLLFGSETTHCKISPT